MCWLVLVLQLFDSFMQGTLLYFRFFVSVIEFFELHKWDEEFKLFNLPRRSISNQDRTVANIWTVYILAPRSGGAD